MRTCFVDLLGCDMSAAYQITFTYLRQLSLHLTTVTKTPRKDSIKTLVNWQYLNSLCLLGQAVMRYYKELDKLLYPLVQVTLGLLKLTNSFYHTPYRLHLLRLLTSLEASAQTYIPGVSAHILEVLTSPELKKRSKPSNSKTFEFYAAIKVSKGDAILDLFKQQLVEETCDVLIEHLAVWGRSPAFPELCVPVKLVIQKHVKDMKVLDT
jgi:nucleolar complex protein 2